MNQLSLGVCFLWAIALAGCGPKNMNDERISVPTERLVNVFKDSSEYEYYVVGFAGKASKNWVAVANLIDRPDAPDAVTRRWKKMSAAGKIYGAAVLQKMNPGEAEPYWSELFRNKWRIRYIAGDVISKRAVADIAKDVQQDMLSEDPAWEIKQLVLEHPVLGRVLGAVRASR